MKYAYVIEGMIFLRRIGLFIMISLGFKGIKVCGFKFFICF